MEIVNNDIIFKIKITDLRLIAELLGEMSTNDTKKFIPDDKKARRLPMIYDELENILANPKLD